MFTCLFTNFLNVNIFRKYSVYKHRFFVNTRDLFITSKPCYIVCFCKLAVFQIIVTHFFHKRWFLVTHAFKRTPNVGSLTWSTDRICERKNMQNSRRTKSRLIFFLEKHWGITGSQGEIWFSKVVRIGPKKCTDMPPWPNFRPLGL